MKKISNYIGEMEAKFVTVGEESYKDKEGKGQNKLGSFSRNWSYQCELKGTSVSLGSTGGAPAPWAHGPDFKTPY
jgi:hypothetical protein